MCCDCLSASVSGKVKINWCLICDLKRFDRMFNTLFIFFAAAAAEEKPNEQHVFRLEFNKIKTKRKE